MSINLHFRIPTVAYGYVELTLTGESPAQVNNDLAGMQKVVGTAIQVTGGGDATAQALRLLAEELGAVQINEDGSPWDQPQAPVQQEWANTPGPADPFSSPSTSDPFGAPAPANDPFAAPARDVYFIDTPNGGLDAWKELRKTLQGSLPKGTIDWDADAKRNTIKKSAPQNILDGLRQRGYTLR